MLEDTRWAIVEDENIQQGDIIPGCIVIKYPPEIFQHVEDNPEAPIDVDYDIYNGIVLTQSYDLEHGKMENILVAPVHEVSEFLAKNPEFTKSDLENIRRNRMHRFYSLRPCEVEGFEREETIIDFRKLVTIPREALFYHVSNLGRRHILKVPFREHLARAFGNSVSRVALPDE